MKSIKKKATVKAQKITTDPSLSKLKDIPFASGKDEEIKKIKFKLNF